MRFLLILASIAMLMVTLFGMFGVAFSFADAYTVWGGEAAPGDLSYIDNVAGSKSEAVWHLLTMLLVVAFGIACRTGIHSRLKEITATNKGPKE